MSKIKIFCMALCGLLFAACSGGDTDDGGNGGGNTNGTPVTVRLSLSTSASSASRAGSTAGGWTAAAVSGEKMKNWFVIITESGSTTIKKIITSSQASETKPLEKETYEAFSFTAGTYDFYSFANITLTDLGLSESSTTLPDGLSDGTKTFEVDGNGFDISSGFIPMSNKQTITISGTSGTVDVDLWVVRMLAKVELQITNDTGSELTLNSVTLSDLTQNAADNLKLLPNPVDKGETGECTPNLGTVTTGVCTFGGSNLPLFVSTSTVSGESKTYTYKKQSDALTIAANGTANVVFYVNESATPSNNQGLFILTLNTANTGSTESTDGTKRYALISTKMASDGGTWDGQIARNDYHIIPVRLTDYKFEIDLEQYEAIGVIPYWQNENDVFTCTFYNPGHFHIIPKVTKISTGTVLNYGESGDATTPTWRLSNFSASVDGHTNDDIYATTTDNNHTDADGNTLSYTGTPLWSAGSHFVYGHFNYTYGKAWCSLSVIVNDGTAEANIAQRTYTYQLCLDREKLSETSTSSGAKRPTGATTSLFGYGRLVKGE